MVCTLPYQPGWLLLGPRLERLAFVESCRKCNRKACIFCATLQNTAISTDSKSYIVPDEFSFDIRPTASALPRQNCFLTMPFIQVESTLKTEGEGPKGTESPGRLAGPTCSATETVSVDSCAHLSLPANMNSGIGLY